MSTETLSHDEAIVQFCGVTGADEERARALLEACEWNLVLAVNMHVDTDPDGRSNRKTPAPGPSTSSSGSNNHHGPSIGHDDDDANDDHLMNVDGRHNDGNRPINRHGRPFDVPGNNSFDRFGASSSGASASNSSYHNDDDVRPPIAPVRQILNPTPIGYPAADMTANTSRRRYNTRTAPGSDVYDAFRDFQAEAQWQEALQDGAESSASESSTNNPNRKRTLQDLYRPPLELIFHGSLTSARECGSHQNKWLLVNIQNGREFACQMLNRDVWSNHAVRDILKEHFIFWQTYHDSYEGQRYVQFYKVTKFPHVAIIDPRTGELMKPWPTTIDHNSFCDSVIEYLTEHPSPDGSGDASTMKKLRVKGEEVKDKDEEDEEREVEIVATRTTLYDQSEEAQLEAAIKASLQESEKPPVDTNDDTIEIDEDTIEALDISDLKRLARDDELIHRSPKRENNSNTKNSNVEPSHQTSSSAPVNNNNSKAEQITKTDNRTTAEVLKAEATNRPSSIDGAECKIALRFPDGSSLVQKFAAQEQLAAVKLFVQMDKSAASASSIEFIAPPNRKLTESMMEETLESLGLCPASRLEVKCIQN